MKVRFQADGDLTRAIVTGLRRRQPEIEFVTAEEAGFVGVPDIRVLAMAADEGRTLVSHDNRSMPTAFGRFIVLPL